MALAHGHWWTDGYVSLPNIWQSSALAIAAVAVTIMAAINQYHRRNFPRGPSRLSAFRGMISDKNLEYKNLWRRQFGSVYTLFIGSVRAIVMTDYDVIYDTFVRQADICSSRWFPSRETAKDVEGNGMNSPHWKEQRKFAISVLREQGMGKIDIEHKIREEITPFMSEIEKHRGRPLNPDVYMHRAISNVICNIVLGSRFDYGDPIFTSLLERFIKQISLLRKKRIVNMMPLLKMLPGDIFGYHRFQADSNTIVDFFLNAIRQHEETLDPASPRDFIDAYLFEMQSRALGGAPSSFDHANCVASVVQLFGAGTDTTANTLLWTWLFMILHPHVQQQVQKEIDRCVGARPPSLNDRGNMPFTEAVLTEVLRLSNTAVNSINHMADADVNVGGYIVPKGTLLFASISDVHLDGSTYANPTEFNPQRFLNSSGAYVKPKKFIPFSIGRRACPGESFARAELFLFFTNVMQNFNLSVPEECVFRAEGNTGFIHKPLPYRVVFQRRLATP